MSSTAPKPPRTLGTGGGRLWRAVLAEYEFEEHELALLAEACRTVDALEALDAVVRRDGPVVASPQGERANPALVEARAQRITLARVLAALRLPAGEEEAGDVRRPQRRGPRGVYGPRAVS